VEQRIEEIKNDFNADGFCTKAFFVTARVVTCPNCHGYRFDDSAERVVEQANILASRPQQSVTSEDLES